MKTKSAPHESKISFFRGEFQRTVPILAGVVVTLAVVLPMTLNMLAVSTIDRVPPRVIPPLLLLPSMLLVPQLLLTRAVLLEGLRLHGIFLAGVVVTLAVVLLHLTLNMLTVSTIDRHAQRISFGLSSLLKRR